MSMLPNGWADQDQTWHRSAIDFFLVNDDKIVCLFDVLDRVCNLSDHVPILVEISGVCLPPKDDRASKDNYDGITLTYLCIMKSLVFIYTEY